MGIRAAGADKKVFLIQFLKTESSENKVIERIKNFKVKSFGRKGFFLPKPKIEQNPELKKQGIKPFSRIDFQLVKKGFSLAEEVSESKRYDLLILDEVNVALKFGLIDIKKFLGFLKKYQKELDIVLTGRNCPGEIIKIADLVTDLREVKHYFKKGVRAKKGIEF